MIKLESSSAGLSASVMLSIQSPADLPVIAVSAEPARSQNSAGQWADDPSKLRQVVRFTTSSGQIELAGVVPESEAVECAAAWRVVVEAGLVERSLPAYEAGQRSRSITGLNLWRVVEVWGASGKRLWTARKDLGGPGAASMDPATGRISKATA